MLLRNLKDYEIKDVDTDDTESLCGALVEVTHILDDISNWLDNIEDGLGTGIFEISTMLDMETKRIEEGRE